MTSRKKALPPLAGLFIFLQVGFAALIIYWWTNIYWWHHLPPPGHAVTVLALGAAVMSADENLNRFKKVTWLLMLAVLAGIEVHAISADRREQDRQFVQTLSTITGGDSFAVLDLKPLGGIGSVTLPNLIQMGDYPLYDLKIRVVRLLMDGRPGDSSVTLLTRDLARKESTQIQDFRIETPEQSAFYRVYYNALNGHWTQDIGLHKVNGTWFEATKALRPDDEGKSCTLYEYTDDGFPRNKNGKPDWGLPGLNSDVSSKCN